MAAGQQRAGIVEQHNAVAQQAPPLLGMSDRNSRGHAVRCQCAWALRLMLAHGVLLNCELSPFIGHSQASARQSELASHDLGD